MIARVLWTAQELLEGLFDLAGLALARWAKHVLNASLQNANTLNSYTHILDSTSTINTVSPKT